MLGEKGIHCPNQSGRYKTRQARVNETLSILAIHPSSRIQKGYDLESGQGRVLKASRKIRDRSGGRLGGLVVLADGSEVLLSRLAAAQCGRWIS